MAHGKRWQTKEWLARFLAVVLLPMWASFAVLSFLTVVALTGGIARAQVVLNFDTTGPTSTAELPDFLDLFGFDADFGSGALWHIDPNTSNPDNNTNALHITSDGNQLEPWFSRVAILKGTVFFGENVELSADITWDDAGGDANDNAGLYVRFIGSSDVPLENDYYFVRAVGSGSPDLRIHKVKGGIQQELIQQTNQSIAVFEGDTHNLRVLAETVGDTVEISVWLDDEAIPGMDPFVDAVDAILGDGRVGVGQETNPSYFDNIFISGPDIGAFTPGDFNNDGAIDLADFSILANNFGTGTMFSQGDNSRDGLVDLRDFVQFVDLYNAAQGGAGAPAVPEPSGTALLSAAIAAVLLLARRRAYRALSDFNDSTFCSKVPSHGAPQRLASK